MIWDIDFKLIKSMFDCVYELQTYSLMFHHNIEINLLFRFFELTLYLVGLGAGLKSIIISSLKLDVLEMLWSNFSKSAYSAHVLPSRSSYSIKSSLSPFIKLHEMGAI